MSRFKWPKNILKRLSRSLTVIKKFFSNLKIGSKKKAFIQILILLIAINGLLWGYRMTRRRYTITDNQKKEFTEIAEKPINEWKVDLDEKLETEKVEKDSISEKKEAKNLNGKQQDVKEKPETLTAKNTVEEDAENITKPVEQQKESNSALATMVVPVFGQVITDHSVDALVYSKTLEQWHAHHGIDIKAKIGSEVKSAISGVVESVVLEDPRLGVVVTIDHGNDLKTIYGNLSKTVPVRNGDKVKKGQVIGQVGKSAPFEIEDPPHLHFEVLKNGKPIDPQQFLPKLN